MALGWGRGPPQGRVQARHCPRAAAAPLPGGRTSKRPGASEGRGRGEGRLHGAGARSRVICPSSMRMLGQNFNAAGIGTFFRVAQGNQALGVPHLSVKDISFVDWARVKAAGFKGCIFDKDNTLTEPYSQELQPGARRGLQACQRVFEDKVVLFSNSAGLKQYDPEGSEAAALEQSLGLSVLRHVDKKPSGGFTEVEHFFGCRSQELVMVGDRYMTDIVFGNRGGMLTILVAPFNTAEEPIGVKLARRAENLLLRRLMAKSVQPPPHGLADAAAMKEFVKGLQS